MTRDGKRLPLDVYARLVARTKTRQAQVTGAENRYKEVGVTTVRIFENAVTCPVCAKYRNMIVVISGTVPGFKTKDEIPLPPYHPNCHGTIRPVVLDFLTEAELAEAKALTTAFHPEKDTRTPVQRKAYAKEQEIRRKAREEVKYYKRMKAVLGNGAPTTVGAFRRMKRSNSKGWQKLKGDYLRAIRE
ncbi:phage minor capsid protein [Domibacillus sp. PGB-M46]|nr:phage minor capsid protein [Domibacillus sp. PGB-M46]